MIGGIWAEEEHTHDLDLRFCLGRYCEGGRGPECDIILLFDNAGSVCGMRGSGEDRAWGKCKSFEESQLPPRSNLAGEGRFNSQMRNMSALILKTTNSDSESRQRRR